MMGGINEEGLEIATSRELILNRGPHHTGGADMVFPNTMRDTETALLLPHPVDDPLSGHRQLNSNQAYAEAFGSEQINGEDVNCS
jgi:hypothetical protein